MWWISLLVNRFSIRLIVMGIIMICMIDISMVWVLKWMEVFM